MSPSLPSSLPFVVTMGEPAGIGGELTLMAWLATKDSGIPVFAAIDDAARLDRLARSLGFDIPIRRIKTPADAIGSFSEALPVLHRPLKGAVMPGQPDPQNASSVIESIDKAVELCLSGHWAGLVTNPIHKESLYSAGFSAPGHTEYLAQIIAARKNRAPSTPVMMLTALDLRVVPVTIHQALKAAIQSLTAEKIVAVARIAAAGLARDFAISKPRIAIAALNPHAGEGGTMGREEIEIIAPAVHILQQSGLSVEGPLAADTLFHAAARKNFDAILCMYHDQALIPLKTLDFWGGVNVTLGLDIVRTSPDHGTAFALAGTGKANPASFIAALKLAAQISQNRSHS